MLGYFLTFDIPEVTHLQDWKPPVVTTIYSADGQVLYQFGARDLNFIKQTSIPEPPRRGAREPGVRPAGEGESQPRSRQ